MEELASIWYNVISLNQKTGKRYMTMTKPTFTDEFKQGVVQYVLDHPDESKVAIADSTVHKWLKDVKNNNGTINSRGSGNYASDEAKEIARLKKELKDTQDALDA